LRQPIECLVLPSRLAVPDQRRALVRGAHVGRFQSGADVFLLRSQRSEAELRLSTYGRAIVASPKRFAEKVGRRPSFQSAAFKARKPSGPYRLSIVSGSALMSIKTRWFAQYLARTIAVRKPERFAGLGCFRTASRFRSVPVAADAGEAGIGGDKAAFDVRTPDGVQTSTSISGTLRVGSGTH
jgi:hypothetical protein